MAQVVKHSMRFQMLVGNGTFQGSHKLPAWLVVLTALYRKGGETYEEAVEETHRSRSDYVC